MATKYAKQTFITVPNRNTLKTVSGHAQLVFMWMCSMQNDRGECYPSYAKLADITGWSRSTVIRAVKELEASGMLRKTRRTKKDEHQTNLYEVMIVDSEPDSTPVTDLSTGSVTQTPHREGVVSQGHHLVSHRHQGSVTGNQRTKPNELNPLNEKEIPEWKRKQQERAALLQRLNPTGRM